MALLWQRQELDDTLHKRFMDAIFTNDIALLANTSAKAESLLHSLERTAGGIGLHVNSDKTEYMCFNQRDDVSTLNGRYLKLRDKFTYLGNIVSSTENNINTNLRRYGQLLGIWKSNQSDKIKRSFFFQAAVVPIILHGRWPSIWRKSFTAIAQECYELYWTNPGGNTPQNSSDTATNNPFRKPSKLYEQNMRDTAGEVRMNS